LSLNENRSCNAHHVHRILNDVWLWVWSVVVQVERWVFLNVIWVIETTLNK
jgi:hypothetical protein